MAVATFDTLKFANTLKAAGVPDKQAEAQAVAFAEVIQINLKDLVTKDDLAASTKEIRQEIADARKELKQELKEVEQRVNTKIDNGLNDVRVQIAAMKGEMVLIRWMLGVVVGGIATLLIRTFFFRGTI